MMFEFNLWFRSVAIPLFFLQLNTMANVKGSLISNRHKFIKERLTVAQATKIEEWFDPQVWPKVKAVIPQGWYPYHYLTDLNDAINDVVSPENPEIMLELGHYSATLASRGVYKIFFKIMSVERILEKASKLWDSLMDSGTCTIVKNAAKDIDYTLTGFPEPIPDSLAVALCGWSKGITEAGGGKNVETKVKYNTPGKFAVNTKWQ